MQFPPLGNAVALISDAACNELIDEGVSVLNYRIWRRNGEYFLSLRVLTDHALSNDYIMVLHMADVDDASEAFVNLDFAPCPPTTDWSPMEAVTVVRQLVCPAVIEFRPEKAVNCVRRSALPAGRYAIWVGLWDLEKGLSGRLARLGLVVLPNSLGTTQN